VPKTADINRTGEFRVPQAYSTQQSASYPVQQ